MSCIPITTETTQNKGYSLLYRNDDVYNPILWIIHTKQQTKQAQPKQPKQRHQRGFHHSHKICALTTETTQILEYSYSNFSQFQKIHIQSISYISCITNLYISSISKNLYMAYVARTKKLVNCCFSQNIAKHKLAAYLIYLCYFFSYLYKYIKDIGQIIWIFL